MNKEINNLATTFLDKEIENFETELLSKQYEIEVINKEIFNIQNNMFKLEVAKIQLKHGKLNIQLSNEIKAN